VHEKVRIKTVTRLVKFIDVDGAVFKELRGGMPLEVAVGRFRRRLSGIKVVEGNVFLNEGINFMWSCVVNGSCSPPFDSANAYIGVGDGATPEDPTQTGLTGTNKYYKGMDSGYPQLSGNQVTFRATFGPNEANFAWNEWTVANGPGDNYTNINRKQESLGTKAQGTTWVLEVTLIIS